MNCLLRIILAYWIRDLSYCPRKREAGRQRQCFKSCFDDSDCRSRYRSCVCDYDCGMSCVKRGEIDLLLLRCSIFIVRQVSVARLSPLLNMERSDIPMETSSVPVLPMNATKAMCSKGANIEIAKGTCGGVPQIRFRTVRKKVGHVLIESVIELDSSIFVPICHLSSDQKRR